MDFWCGGYLGEFRQGAKMGSSRPDRVLVSNKRMTVILSAVLVIICVNLVWKIHYQAVVEVRSPFLLAATKDGC